MSGAIVSIHAPAWGATANLCEISPDDVFQSTRPRGARPPSARRPPSFAPVSIHAPAWGATVKRSAAVLFVRKFQSTRPRGARQAIWQKAYSDLKFQSTRPRGARHIELYYARIKELVSIHAPAWGATSGKRSRKSGSTCFNPRARVGRDGHGHVHSFQVAMFQSTRPRGARLLVSMASPLLRPFQSTRPRGARPGGGFELSHLPFVSIHAPAWGATFLMPASALGMQGFNPRARVGRDA